MATLDNLPYFIKEITDVIEEQFVKINQLWEEQELEEQYKISYVSSIIKLNCCYYLVNEWKKTNKGHSDIMDILEACKNDYENKNNSPIPNIFYSDASELMKYYVYRKCEILIDNYVINNS